MNADDILLKMILNQITVSQALQLTKLHCSQCLSKESIHWIDREIDGYENVMFLPNYRLLECDLYIEVYDALGNKTVQRLDTTYISNYLKEGGYESTSPNKMRITQGIESLEKNDNKEFGNIKMYLDDNLKKMILSWYNFPLNTRFGKIFQESDIEYVKVLLAKVKSQLISILQYLVTSDSSISKNVESNQSIIKKKIFISYGWEDEQHNAWVHNLAKRLSEDFEVSIDAQQPLGLELNLFMENMVSNSDRVLMILTPTYKNKADKRENGVGYESVIISDEIFMNQSTIKIIPIIRKGSRETSFPKYIGNRKALDMSNDDEFEKQLEILINDIKTAS